MAGVKEVKDKAQHLLMIGLADEIFKAEEIQEDPELVRHMRIQAARVGRFFGFEMFNGIMENGAAIDIDGKPIEKEKKIMFNEQEREVQKFNHHAPKKVMATATPHAWDFVIRLVSGHRIFHDEEGKLAIVDNSGIDPDRCDDGPDYIHMTKPAYIRGYGEGKIYVDISVYGPRIFERAFVMVYLEDVPALKSLGMTVILDKSASHIAGQWRRAIAILDGLTIA